MIACLHQPVYISLPEEVGLQQCFKNVKGRPRAGSSRTLGQQADKLCHQSGLRDDLEPWDRSPQ